MILYIYKEKGRISMNIRVKQVEKAKRMIDAKDKAIATAFASHIKETAGSNFDTCFTAVTNAFLDLGRAADCASTAIANLVPNIRKRG